MHVGRIIKELRRKRRKKATVMAVELGYANRQSIYDIEKRPALPMCQLEEIARLLEVDVAVFGPNDVTVPNSRELMLLRRENYRLNEKITALQMELSRLKRNK